MSPKKQQDTPEEDAVIEDEEEVTTGEEIEPENHLEDEVEAEPDPEIEEISEKEEKELLKTEKVAIPDFRAGDTVRVFYKIIEGDKTRIQPYEGIVIARKGKDVSKTFTVRRIGADGIGVERIFPLHSPNIIKLEVKRKGKVRRAKLYYLRKKKGRAAVKVKERKAS